MTEDYETFELVWRQRMITVSFQTNWLHSGQGHIELRSTDRLPVSATGYRSHFLPLAEDANQARITTYVMAWLDAAADTKEWRRYEKDRRQLKLF